MCSEALQCRLSKSRENKNKANKKKKGCTLYRQNRCHKVLKQIPVHLNCFAVSVERGVLPWADLSVVLCELSEGFKGLWVPNQYCRIRQAVVPTGWWYRWW